jgi:predicted MFS family arabinose efflux permease
MGRVGTAFTAPAISWSGIASYGALALGAPTGVWLDSRFGLWAVGMVGIVAALAGILWASTIAGVATQPGKGLPFRRVLGIVLPYGLCLALGGIGFGTIASFLLLYFANHHWPDAALSLSLFGVSFVAARLLFTNTINKWGGHPVAMVSLAIECSGLILLWLAPNSAAAHGGVALAGCGFALVFPALGVEAVRNILPQSRGSALGVYTAFVDLSMGISGPIAGAIVSVLGYPPIFLFAAVMAALAAALQITLWKTKERFQ